uniref:molybdate ABC transporter substrate-binding protein n=1 Tax=Halomonas sp. TaxID=1486246 RepID=UPI00262462C6|nr:molybdate ABC transporter substrate-binding protein [Halomonas sp.]
MLGHRPEFLLSARQSLFALALLATASLATSSLAQAATLHVSAAASLTGAMDDAIETYTANHPDVSIVPIYASSSTLARQIASGAPSDLFISANLKWMDWLEEQDVELQGRTNLLQNRLALIAPAASDVTHFIPGKDGAIESLIGADDRLAVGDPSHVPAGIYAQQALASLGEWETMEPRLARANDVRGALALVERGETPVGIVYQTDAKASEGVRTLGLFPLESHEPIVYPIAQIGAGENDDVEAFRAWLEDQEAQDIFTAHGFMTASSNE